MLKCTGKNHDGTDCGWENPDDARYCGGCGKLLNDDARSAVALALEETAVKVERGSYGSSHVRDTNSLQVWRRLYASLGDAVIEPLCAIVQTPETEWVKHWKALTFLRYALRTPDGRQSVLRILDAVADCCLGAGHVAQLAIALILEAPAPPEDKWERLFGVAQSAPPDRVAALLGPLAQVTPPGERERTGNLVLDLLTYSPHVNHLYTNALRTLGSRHAIPKLREIVENSSCATASEIAKLLCEWDDKASAPSIRRAIENYRYSNDGGLRGVVLSLYNLEHHDCVAYLAEVLLSAQPTQQKCIIDILNSPMKGVRNGPVLEAVREIAASSVDVGLKNSAQKFIEAD